MIQADFAEIFRDLNLFDSVILYRRAILEESYQAIGDRLGYSYEDIRTRYSTIIKTIRRRLERDY